VKWDDCFALSRSWIDHIKLLKVVCYFLTFCLLLIYATGLINSSVLNFEPSMQAVSVKLPIKCKTRQTGVV